MSLIPGTFSVPSFKQRLYQHNKNYVVDVEIVLQSFFFFMWIKNSSVKKYWKNIKLEKLNVQSVVVVYDILYLPPVPPVAANANFKKAKICGKNAGLSVFAGQVQNRQHESAKKRWNELHFWGGLLQSVSHFVVMQTQQTT